MTGGKTANNKQNLLLAGVLAAVAAYFVLFYAARLPSLKGRLAAEGTLHVPRRADMLAVWLLLPDEALLSAWFGSPPQLALLDRLPVLLAAGAILAVGAAAGWLMMVAARADRGLSGLETFVFATAVGLGALSTYVLAVGLLGLLRSALVYALPGALVLAAAAWLYLRRRRADASPPSPTAPPHPSSLIPHPSNSWLDPRWLWLASPFVAAIVLGAMLPPVDFDAREYHLQVPKEWFAQGRIDFLPHNVYGNMPMGAEVLSLPAMWLLGDWWPGALAGKTVIAAYTLLCAAALLAAGRRFFSPAAGIVAALVYLSTPWIVQVSTSGLVEGASACTMFLAVYAVLLWRQESTTHGPRARLGHVLMAGYLAGAAVSIKYPAVLFVVVPLAVWILAAGVKKGDKSHFSQSGLAAPDRRGKKWDLSPFLAFLLAVILGCGLWFAKNAALTGNPTYPLLYSVFGGKTWTPEKDARWSRVHRAHDFSPRALDRDLSRVLWRSEWLSPLLVPLAVLALVDRRKRRLALGLLGLFGYVIAAWWLLTHRIDRFWVPALPLVALLAGWGACWRRDRAWRIALLVVLIAGLGADFLFCTAGPGGYNRYFVSLDRLRRRPEEVDDRVDPWHRYFNRHASGGRVLLVGDAEPFDLEVPVLYNTCFDDCIFEQIVAGEKEKGDKSSFSAKPAGTTERSSEKLDLSPLSARGITHVFVDWDEIARYRKPGNYGFTDFVQPEVFRRLVDAGVLEPLPEIEGHRGRGYRVVVQPAEVALERGSGLQPRFEPASRDLLAPLRCLYPPNHPVLLQCSCPAGPRGVNYWHLGLCARTACQGRPFETSGRPPSWSRQGRPTPRPPFRLPKSRLPKSWRLRKSCRPARPPRPRHSFSTPRARPRGGPAAGCWTGSSPTVTGAPSWKATPSWRASTCCCWPSWAGRSRTWPGAPRATCARSNCPTGAGPCIPAASSRSAAA